MMETISGEDQQILDCMKEAVSDVLERKRLLGQYAVIWEDGRPATIGGMDATTDAKFHPLSDLPNQPSP